MVGVKEGVANRCGNKFSLMAFNFYGLIRTITMLRSIWPPLFAVDATRFRTLVFVFVEICCIFRILEILYLNFIISVRFLFYLLIGDNVLNLVVSTTSDGGKINLNLVAA